MPRKMTNFYLLPPIEGGPHDPIPGSGKTRTRCVCVCVCVRACVRACVRVIQNIIAREPEYLTKHM